MTDRSTGNFETEISAASRILPSVAFLDSNAPASDTVPAKSLRERMDLAKKGQLK